jgi:hypothetical protein
MDIQTLFSILLLRNHNESIFHKASPIQPIMPLLTFEKTSSNIETTSNHLREVMTTTIRRSSSEPIEKDIEKVLMKGKKKN